MKTRPALLTLATATLALTAVPAGAATWTSNGTAGANWSVADHWSGDIAPVAGDSLAFGTPASGGTRTTSNDFAADTSFTNISITANAYTLAGNSIILTGNVANDFGTSSISLQVSLSSGNHTFSNGATRRIDFNGDITGSGGLEVIGLGSLRLQGVGKTYSGNTLVSAGTLDLNVANALPSGTGKGDVTVNSTLGIRFNQAINGLNGTNTGTVTTFAGNRQLQVGNNDANGTYAGAITQGTGLSFVKVGAGTQTLSGASTYTGATTVSAGTLLVNGSLGATAVTANGGTFGGSGAIGGNVTINTADFAAGASAGSMEIAGNLGLTATSTTRIELGGTAFTLNGTEEYDRTKLTGATSALTLGSGALTISLINSFALAANQTFGIFQLESGATRAGTFNGLANDGDVVASSGGYNLLITYSGNFGDTGTVDIAGGNDIVLYTVAAVPEPAAAGLGAIGMILLLRRRRV